MSLWVSATGSHARPPADVLGGDASTYGIFAGRLDAAFDWGTAMAAGQLGSAFAGADGRWLRGDFTLTAGRRLGRMVARGSATGFGLHYLDPFAYDAFGVEVRPSLSTWVADVTVSARPLLTLGQWTTDTLEGDLAVGGMDLELERAIGPYGTAVSAGALSVANGATTGYFFRGGAEVSLARGLWSVSARLDGQRSPMETEIGGGVTLAALIGSRAQLNVHAGRAVRDPLFGTEGTTVISAGLAVRPFRRTPPSPPPVVAVGDAGPEGRRVTFTLAVRDAAAVALIGDFTDWEPVPMTRAGSGWRLERILPAGLYHFAFIVDGVWAMPSDAPGLVDDGWGRKNASVVVEP